MVSSIMARDPHVSSPASVLKLDSNIHLQKEPGQKRKQTFLYFLSNKTFYNSYSFRIQMMLKVFFMLHIIIIVAVYQQQL